MCRSCSEGGRRCPRTEATRSQERAASARYYQRGKSRQKIAQLADAGIPAVCDVDMPATFHQHDPDTPVDFDGTAVANPRLSVSDKPEGAFWTAPGRTDADGNTKTAWTDWAAAEDFGNGGALSEVSPRAGAVVVTVSTPEDAQALMDSYGTTDAVGERAFDWEAMQADGIDGVHVNAGMAANAVSASMDKTAPYAAGKLVGWDTASVAWLSTSQLDTGQTRQVGTYTYAEPDSNGHRRLISEDGEGSYDEPARPDTDTAWDRVPARFKPRQPDTPQAAPQVTSQPAAEDATGTENPQETRPDQPNEADQPDQPNNSADDRERGTAPNEAQHPTADAPPPQQAPGHPEEPEHPEGPTGDPAPASADQSSDPQGPLPTEDGTRAQGHAEEQPQGEAADEYGAYIGGDSADGAGVYQFSTSQKNPKLPKEIGILDAASLVLKNLPPRSKGAKKGGARKAGRR